MWAISTALYILKMSLFNGTNSVNSLSILCVIYDVEGSVYQVSHNAFQHRHFPTPESSAPRQNKSYFTWVNVTAVCILNVMTVYSEIIKRNVFLLSCFSGIHGNIHEQCFLIHEQESDVLVNQKHKASPIPKINDSNESLFSWFISFTELAQSSKINFLTDRLYTHLDSKNE